MLTQVAEQNDFAREAAHLRQLLEKQPSCVVRTNLDGQLLAVNDAAMHLLGAQRLEQVLGRNLPEWLLQAAGEWRDFSTRVWTSGSGSFECGLRDLEVTGRTVACHAVALREHPDGITSLLLVIRDASVARTLERDLQENDLRQEAEARHAEFEVAVAEQARLAARLRDEETERQRLSDLLQERDSEVQRVTALLGRTEATIAQRDADHAAHCRRLQQSVEEQQLALMLKERDEHQRVQRLQAEIAEARIEQVSTASLLEDAIAESRRLEAALAARDAERQRLEGEYTARAAAHEGTGRQALEQLQADLEHAVSEQNRLAALVEESTVERRRLEAAVAERDADARRLASTVADHEAGRQRLEAAIAEHQAERERFEAEHAARAAATETEGREALEHLREELARAVAEQRRLSASFEASASEHGRLEATIAELTAREQQLDADYAARSEAQRREDAEVIAQLKLDLDQSLAERQQLASWLEDSVAARERLEAKVRQHEHDEARREADVAARTAGIEQTLLAAHEQALLRERREHRDQVAVFESQIAQLDAQLADALAEHQRLRAAFADTETERRRVESMVEALAAERQGFVARFAAAREQLERELGQRHEDVLKQERAEQQQRLADFQAQIADLQSQLACSMAEHSNLTGALKHTQSDRDRLAALELQLSRSTAEHERLTALVEQREREHERLQALLDHNEAERERLANEFTTDRTQAERALADSLVGKRKLLKTLADQRIDLQRVQETVRALEPLAAAGRLALDLVRELQNAVLAVDTRTSTLLRLSALDSAYRQDAEALRADAQWALSLTRQLVQTKVQTENLS